MVEIELECYLIKYLTTVADSVSGNRNQPCLTLGFRKDIFFSRIFMNECSMVGYISATNKEIKKILPIHEVLNESNDLLISL